MSDLLDEQPGWKFKQKRESGTTFKQQFQWRRQQGKVKLHLNSLLIIVINIEHAPLAAAQSSHVHIVRWGESYVYNSLFNKEDWGTQSIYINFKSALIVQL